MCNMRISLVAATHTNGHNDRSGWTKTVVAGDYAKFGSTLGSSTHRLCAKPK
jgi:hypothetical protein